MDKSAAEDLFAPFGRVVLKRMFGALGVYYQGMIIACVLDRGIMLKSDAQTDPAFIAAGGVPWHYTHAKGGRQIRMPYCTIPESALDDEDEFRKWCRLSFEAAKRAEISKTAKPARKPKAIKKPEPAKT